MNVDEIAYRQQAVGQGTGNRLPDALKGKVSIVGDSIYAIVRFKSPWWKFWRPREYRRLIELDLGMTYTRSSVIVR